MIVCICRGVNDRTVQAAIDAGATSVMDLMRCGIGDQCGSCHNSLRAMLAASAARSAQPCPCTAPADAPAVAVSA